MLSNVSRKDKISIQFCLHNIYTVIAFITATKLLYYIILCSHICGEPHFLLSLCWQNLGLYY
uniref:Uncharacterized protein n=1 Tax=Anguilla anguilla TaxID=7936 RepID=A0A0E9VKA0_ANGAN